MKKYRSILPALLISLISVIGGSTIQPKIALAAAISPGDLIKGSRSAVYYYGGDGKRYVFPTEQTYKTWYSDFTSVKTITDAELAAITIGGNITIRPGTKLIKITTDPRVYAVRAVAILAPIPNEETAHALYGDDWAKRVVDIPDAFFTNYTVSVPLDSATYPYGSLIQKPGQGEVYYSFGAQIRKIASEEAFSQNNFQKENIITTSDNFVLPDIGSDIIGYEDDLSAPLGMPKALKPVIYLYPTQAQKLSVRLDYDGKIIADYPNYNFSTNGWEVTAYPDGRLVNREDNKEYSYLFWEGEPSKMPGYDLSEGFVVKGFDTKQFLQTKLEEIGLTPKEYNEFIVYWYPKMKDNSYNLIHFAGKEYTDTARLTINPKPDSVLRVFMVYKPLAGPINIKPQQIRSFVRNGFAVVEWGGNRTEVNNFFSRA